MRVTLPSNLVAGTPMTPAAQSPSPHRTGRGRQAPVPAGRPRPVPRPRPVFKPRGTR
ncbi:hypothetical protein HNR12_003561 [Streptomonospora nanhaiensis]|uniref:Uncharacterized protein n=1 Tax=Streptomonospora nanhaiensis TaxID=1323731 RepID=A0A853BR08_9ACTN|nr:hypothetical protein [Streptomonospora nanhaiensis]